MLKDSIVILKVAWDSDVCAFIRLWKRPTIAATKMPFISSWRTVRHLYLPRMNWNGFRWWAALILSDRPLWSQISSPIWLCMQNSKGRWTLKRRSCYFKKEQRRRKRRTTGWHHSQMWQIQWKAALKPMRIILSILAWWRMVHTCKSYFFYLQYLLTSFFKVKKNLQFATQPVSDSSADMLSSICFSSAGKHCFLLGYVGTSCKNPLLPLPAHCGVLLYCTPWQAQVNITFT